MQQEGILTGVGVLKGVVRRFQNNGGGGLEDLKDYRTFRRDLKQVSEGVGDLRGMSL